MSVLLGISRNRKPLAVPLGNESYWCVHRTNKAQPGDLLLLYFTGSGIRQVYSIEAVDTATPVMDCQTRGMQTVTISLIGNLATPVTVSQLKTHSVLQDMGAVRRNFQKTIFKVAPGHWPYLFELLVRTDRQLETVLRPYAASLPGQTGLRETE